MTADCPPLPHSRFLPRDCRPLHIIIDPDGHSQEFRPVFLPAGTTVFPLYHGADQDGWNGEIICRLDDGRHVAIEPENLPV